MVAHFREQKFSEDTPPDALLRVGIDQNLLGLQAAKSALYFEKLLSPLQTESESSKALEAVVNYFVRHDPTTGLVREKRDPLRAFIGAQLENLGEDDAYRKNFLLERHGGDEGGILGIVYNAYRKVGIVGEYDDSNLKNRNFYFAAKSNKNTREAHALTDSLIYRDSQEELAILTAAFELDTTNCESILTNHEWICKNPTPVCDGTTESIQSLEKYLNAHSVYNALYDGLAFLNHTKDYYKDNNLTGSGRGICLKQAVVVNGDAVLPDQKTLSDGIKEIKINGIFFTQDERAAFLAEEDVEKFGYTFNIKDFPTDAPLKKLLQHEDIRDKIPQGLNPGDVSIDIINEIYTVAAGYCLPEKKRK